MEYMNFTRFILNQMSPEETIAYFHPQIYCISQELTEECPAVITRSNCVDGESGESKH
jgi:hypothetical protein